MLKIYRLSVSHSKKKTIFIFEQLIDLCGIDFQSYGKADWETDDTSTTGFSRGVSKEVYDDQLGKPARFAVVYHLLSLKHNRRLRLRAYINSDPPRIDSVVDIWASANWFEREAFDLFGIMFEGHPDFEADTDGLRLHRSSFPEGFPVRRPC